MTAMNQLKIARVSRQILAACLVTLIAACDSGETLSGGDPGELAILDATAFVGVYNGNESISLTRQSDSEVVDTQENEVQFTINADGSIGFTSASGASGSANLQQNQQFTLRSDAATNFDGRCESGVVILTLNVAEGTISGVYQSEDLICGGEAFAISGEVSAVR